MKLQNKIWAIRGILIYPSSSYPKSNGTYFRKLRPPPIELEWGGRWRVAALRVLLPLFSFAAVNFASALAREWEEKRKITSQHQAGDGTKRSMGHLSLEWNAILNSRCFCASSRHFSSIASFASCNSRQALVFYILKGEKERKQRRTDDIGDQ